MKIAFLSNLPDGTTFKLGSHHLARELAQLGHKVAHISTPVSVLEHGIGRKVSGRDPRTWRKLYDAEKLLEHGPYVDPRGVVHAAPRPIVPLALFKRPGAVQTILEHIDFSDADFALVDRLALVPSLDAFHGAVIYRPTDVIEHPGYQYVERALLERADGVVAASSHVQERVLELGFSGPMALIENGVDDAWLDLPTTTGPERSGIIYVGAVDRRFDWAFATRLAKELPEEVVTLYGPVSEPSGHESPPNLRLAGPVPYEDLPALMSSARIGILPMNSDPTNLGRSPMKYYEYLARGLFVVATSTPALEARGQVAGAYLYESIDDGIRAIRGLLASNEDWNREGQTAATRFAWSRRAVLLEDFLAQLSGHPDG